MRCPELEVLQGRAWSQDVRAHVAGCGSCKLVMELIDERSQAAQSRERRAECARFEGLIAVRVGAELQGAAHTMLEEHLRECSECRAIANTMAPAEVVDHTALPEIDKDAYALGGEVARGGMGRILAARDLRIGRPVAVKELLSKNAGLAARFEREARVTARLQHPGIVPIYEIGRWESGTPFYAMRMVEGKTLRAALLDRPTLAERLALLPSVIAAAEAVAFAHAHQVIHRDLTPSNILVGEYGETVVIDWGLAKDLSEVDEELDPYRRDPNAAADLTAAGAVIGTASYMPPEQAAGERVDERADVYALGAILYHVLAGQPPYKGTLDDVLRAVKQEPPKPLPATTPRDLASIVSKAMSRDPAERYPSARELAAELTAFTAGRLVDAHEYTRGELLRRWMRKRRAALTVAALAVVALCVFGVFAVRRILDERDEADEQRVIADLQRRQSETLSTSLLIEQGRQELLAGKHERAAALLSEAYQHDQSALLRALLGAALRGVSAQETVIPAATEIAKYLEVSSQGEVLGAGAVGSWIGKKGGRQLLGGGGIGIGDQVPHFSADGNLVVSVEETKVRVWSSAGREINSLDAGRGVGWAGFSRDGKALLAITDDGGWIAWDSSSWTRLHGVSGTKSAIGARPANGRVAPFVDELLAIVTTDGRVTVWDWRSASQLTSIEHGGQISSDFASDFDGTHLVTCGLDGRIKRWHARTGKRETEIVEPTGAVLSCDLAKDLRIASVSAGGSLRVWAADGSVLMTSTIEPSIARFALEDTRLVTQLLQGVVSVRDPVTGSIVVDLGAVTGLAALHDASIYLPRRDGSVQRAHLGQVGIARGYIADPLLQREASSRDARMMLVRSRRDGRISALDLASGSQTPLPISAPAVISDDGTLAVGWARGEIAIVRTTGELVGTIRSDRAPYRYVLSPDNGRLLGRFGDGSVTLWDVATSERVAFLSADDHQLFEFDATGRVLLLTQIGSLMVWNPPAPPRRLTEQVWQIHQSFDGHYLAVTDGRVGTEVFDMTSQRSVTFIEGSMFAAFDAVGHLYAHLDGSIAVYDTNSWAKRRQFTITDTTTAIEIAVNPDGSLIATSRGVWSADGRLITTFDRGAPATRMPGRQLQFDLEQVRFTHDGSELIIDTGSSLRVWDLRPETRTPAEIANLVASRVGWHVDDGRLVPTTVPSESVVASRTIRGRVMFHGKPVADATVTIAVDQEQREAAITSSDGRFEVRTTPGNQRLMIWSKAHGAFGMRDVVASEQTEPVAIELDLEASIEGRVVDTTGRPRSDIVVSARISTTDDEGHDVTDAKGAFRIGALSGGGEYVIVLHDKRTGAEVAGHGNLRVRLESKTSHVRGVEFVISADTEPTPDRLDERFYYRLSTAWHTAARVLDVDGREPFNDLQFAPTGAFTGQLWRLTPDAGAYRLSTVFQGERKTLGFTDKLVLVPNGTQRWKVERANAGYRIQLQGTALCATAGLTLGLAPCDDSPEQTWLLAATPARVPAN